MNVHISCPFLRLYDARAWTEKILRYPKEQSLHNRMIVRKLDTLQKLIEFRPRIASPLASAIQSPEKYSLHSTNELPRSLEIICDCEVIEVSLHDDFYSKYNISFISVLAYIAFNFSQFLSETLLTGASLDPPEHFPIFTSECFTPDVGKTQKRKRGHSSASPCILGGCVWTARQYLSFVLVYPKSEAS